MRALWRQNFLLFKNTLDQAGPRAFTLRISLYAWLNIIMIALILHPMPPGTAMADYLCRQYVYFLPMLALSASVSSFEIELFSGTGEWLLLARRGGFPARLLTIGSELVLPVLGFACLFVYTERSLADWILAATLLVLFTWLGMEIAFLWGFRNEKSINNFCHAIIWILGFGPGPFMGLEVKGYQFLFPGAQALNGNYIGEMIKLSAYVAAGAAIHVIGQRPRHYRFFAK